MLLGVARGCESGTPSTLRPRRNSAASLCGAVQASGWRSGEATAVGSCCGSSVPAPLSGGSGSGVLGLISWHPPTHGRALAHVPDASLAIELPRAGRERPVATPASLSPKPGTAIRSSRSVPSVTRWLCGSASDPAGRRAVRLCCSQSTASGTALLMSTAALMVAGACGRRMEAASDCTSAHLLAPELRESVDGHALVIRYTRTQRDARTRVLSCTTWSRMQRMHMQTGVRCSEHCATQLFLLRIIATQKHCHVSNAVP